MYCIKCGVELKDSEEKCPLCGTVVFHPDIKRPDGEKPYPAESRRPAETATRSGMLFITSIMFLVPFVLSLLCDWKVNGTLVWSGYAAGALALTYIIVVLPMWFCHAIRCGGLCGDRAIFTVYRFCRERALVPFLRVPRDRRGYAYCLRRGNSAALS